MASTFRLKPDLSKHSFETESEEYHVATTSMCGWRSNMEDAHLIDVDFDGSGETGLFGVFDGHGGQLVALFASRNLRGLVRNDKQFNAACTASVGVADVCLPQDPKVPASSPGTSVPLSVTLSTGGFLPQPQPMSEVLTNAFIECDSALRETTEFSAFAMGSTANLVVISPTHIHCASVGDSRAVLYSGGFAIPLSTDHKPNSPGEAARLKAAGMPVSDNRVFGSLAMSRALGDFFIKTAPANSPQEMGVSPCPEVTSRPRDRAADEFLVIGCDGIWDCLTCEEVCAFVVEELAVHSDGALICENLCRACVSSRVTAPVGTDNMTVILLRFKRENIGT